MTTTTTLAQPLSERPRPSPSGEVIVIGGGLAGSEAAWQAAQQGAHVTLYEMRPEKRTTAHQTGRLAELVCSNSMGSTQADRAMGLLKNELAFDCNAISVRADSPYKTLQDLIDASKKKPLTQGGGSITSSESVGGYLIKKATGAQWEFVSFNSGGEAQTALLGGHVDFINASPAEVAEQVRAGKVRPLAVNTEKRLDMWPDVPTLKELKIPYPTGIIRGILLPKDVPADTVKYWESALTKMRGTEAWKKYLKENALVDAWMGPEEFKSYLASSSKNWDTWLGEMGLKKK